MKLNYFFLAILCIVCFASISPAQTGGKSKSPQNPIKTDAKANKSSPAFAEILLRKTEIAAELEDYLTNYTDEFPKVKELRFELDLLNKEMNRILAVNPTDSAKLSLALGKLMLRKIELERDVWNLRKQYNDEHPDVKQALRKVAVFEAAIKEIL